MKSGKTAQTYVKPMRVFVGRRTKAEKGFRARISMPEPTVLAPGLPPTPEHDLIFNGGNAIEKLVFTNFYVGGSDAWQASDIQSIDQALASAMSDTNLNNLMSQYYPSGDITSTFPRSQTLPAPPPQPTPQSSSQ